MYIQSGRIFWLTLKLKHVQSNILARDGTAASTTTLGKVFVLLLNNTTNELFVDKWNFFTFMWNLLTLDLIMIFSYCSTPLKSFDEEKVTYFNVSFVRFNFGVHNSVCLEMSFDLYWRYPVGKGWIQNATLNCNCCIERSNLIWQMTCQ